MQRKLLTLILILLMLLSCLPLVAASEPVNTWSLVDTFTGSSTKDFSVSTPGLPSAAYYELYIAGYSVGRLPSSQKYSTVGMMFSDITALKVLFYDSETAVTPIAEATCQTGGILNVTNSQPETPVDSWKAVDSAAGAVTQDFSVQIHSLTAAQYYELYVDDVLIDRKPIGGVITSSSILFTDPTKMSVKFYDSDTANYPIAEASCGSDGTLVVTHLQPLPSNGMWYAQAPYQDAYTRVFGLRNVSGLTGAAYYELNVNGILIGTRIAITEQITSDPTIFSQPDKLLVKFYSSTDALYPVGQASCEADGRILVTALAQPTNNGTWYADPPFIGAATRSFGIRNLTGIEGANFYKLKVDGVSLERAAINETLISDATMFSKPELLQLLFYRNRDDLYPLGVGTCEADGRIVVTLIDQPASNGNWYVSTPYEGALTRNFGISDLTGLSGAAYYDLLVRGTSLGRVRLDQVITSDPAMFTYPGQITVRFYSSANASYAIGEATCEADGRLVLRVLPMASVIGNWKAVAPWTGSPTKQFLVANLNGMLATHYELWVDGIKLGRKGISEQITSDGTILAQPALLRVKFYDSATASDPIAEADCSSDGALYMAADYQAPQLLYTQAASDQHTITLVFSEKLYYSDIDSLKSTIRLSVNRGAFNNLTDLDRVSVDGNKLIIEVNDPLSPRNNQCSVNGNLLWDASHNVQSQTITTSNVRGAGCFIATAAFGSYLNPHVWVLRQFRDQVLLKSKLGRWLVSEYYQHSPPIAAVIAHYKLLRLLVRWVLTPIILMVQYPAACSIVLFTLLGYWYIRYRERRIIASQ